MPTAYSYIRFSTPEQAEGDSLRRQTEKTVAWCKKKGVRLDTTERLHDLGVSGHSGKHRSDRYALGRFLRKVEDGLIPKGSYLVIESLDRLSREEVWDGVELVGKILRAGVTIVQTEPEQEFRRDDADPMKLIILVMELARGYRESKRKSELVRPAWQQKKRELAEGKAGILTSRVPFWLKVEGDQFKPIAENVKLVRRIFQLSADGKGAAFISRTLNNEGVKTARGRRWVDSTALHILRSRAVLGEYTPHEVRMVRDGDKVKRVRTPVHDPIPSYYPPIITPELFNKVQRGLRARVRHGGRQHAKGVNLFTGIVRHYQTKDRYVLKLHLNKQKGDKPKKVAYRLEQYGHRKGNQSSVDYAKFERVILGHVKELTPKDLLPKDVSHKATRLTELRDEIAELEHRVGEVQQQLADPKKNSARLFPILDQLDAELTKKREQYQQAEQEAESSKPETLTTAQSLITAVEKKPELRGKLRNELARLMKSIDLWVTVRQMRTGFWARLTLSTGTVRDVFCAYCKSHWLKTFSLDTTKGQLLFEGKPVGKLAVPTEMKNIPADYLDDWLSLKG